MNNKCKKGLGIFSGLVASTVVGGGVGAGIGYVINGAICLAKAEENCVGWVPLIIGAATGTASAILIAAACCLCKEPESLPQSQHEYAPYATSSRIFPMNPGPIRPSPLATSFTQPLSQETLPPLPSISESPSPLPQPSSPTLAAGYNPQ
ncbi:MAG: hypothetical protein WCW01_01320 [Gammaproteobacteria bacterium]